ncbi:nucleotidyltransferase domain-containing protein [Novosphingobium sp. ERN07]|uniref:nucleotidyltransferase family protein n=1 Tax=Novosphingobium sp. ERN07 TaxID=2726187 RepID=UPI001456DAE6|nr:nucleotidyltransferase domain-containing protein [Novosphingobium sp. ERN07]
MTDALRLAPDELAQVREILSRCLPEGVSVRVFGSRASGAPKAWSDLDLALDGREALPLSLLAILREAFDESPLPWKVDLVDYRSVSPEFAAIIDRDSVPLF